MRDKILMKAGVARRLLDNDDFKFWFENTRDELISRLERTRVTHSNQPEVLEILREFQGHMYFKQRLVAAMRTAEEKQNPPTKVDRV